MIMCSNCKKRPAVVFITSVQGSEKKNEGLCLACAREKRYLRYRNIWTVSA